MFSKVGISVLPLLFFATLTGFFVVDVKASPTTWIIETVDASADVGQHSSIAIDSDGFPHVAYYDLYWANLKYATPSRIPGPGPLWVITPVDTPGEVGSSSSLALDSGDNPHISYYDHTNGDLKHARWTGSAWSIETVDAAGNVGSYTSLALDSGDHPHICYFDETNGDLKHARWTGSAWSIETVDVAGTGTYASVGMYCSLALDSGNHPHISYFDEGNGDLKYARWTGSAWSIETVDTARDVGRFTSLALDSGDNPHISYYYSFDAPYGDLKYARWTGSAWSIETVDSTNFEQAGHIGEYTSIALDSRDNPHISYCDAIKYNDEDLKYARWTGSAWSIETVDAADGVGQFTSLALDSEGKPHISYYDRTNHNLKYAATSDEYFTDVGVILRDSDGDGHDDAVELLMDADTSYSGTITVTVYAYLFGPQGYPPVYANSTSWSITGKSVEHESIWLHVPPGSSEGLYDVELTLCDDENFLEDRHYEVDIYLYAPAQVLGPLVESCNPTGNRKDTFSLGETVYVCGEGFSPSATYTFYILEDSGDSWYDGKAIPLEGWISNTVTTISADAQGNFGPTAVWVDPQIMGKFDVIVDVNGNGRYDVGIDALDDGDVEITAGLYLVPEFSAILILPLFALATLLARHSGYEKGNPDSGQSRCCTEKEKQSNHFRGQNDDILRRRISRPLKIFRCNHDIFCERPKASLIGQNSEPCSVRKQLAQSQVNR
jgi:hypothetical protein